MRQDKPTAISAQLEKYKETIVKRQKYVHMEYQAYGLELAKELGDWKNRSIYIRMSKNMTEKFSNKPDTSSKTRIQEQLKPLTNFLCGNSNN